MPMFTGAVDLAFNVGHALSISSPDYVRSILGDPRSWYTDTCDHTELQLAEPREWSRGFPALAHILIQAFPWKPPGAELLPFSDLLFRPSAVFRYPEHTGTQNPTPEQAWFFINGICTDRSVVELNAQYLYELFGRPLTVLHNYTRGIAADLAACAVGKEWDRVTESVTVAYPAVYAALKDSGCRRVILLAHSQGTILSAVILHLLKGLHPQTHRAWTDFPPESPEHAVARKLAEQWDFEASIQAARSGAPRAFPMLPWPGHRPQRLKPVTVDELRKLEIYCFANCATDMLPVTTPNGSVAPFIESYGNDEDIVARLGVLAKTSGRGRAQIGGDRYRRRGAWGHLLNAHYLHPMVTDYRGGDPRGGLTPLRGNTSPSPRLFGYLDRQSPP